MDKAARALQIAGCIAHTGDAFVYSPAGDAAVSFTANPEEEPLPSDAEGRRVGTQPARMVRLTAARALFSARLPVVGEQFTGDGLRYRIAALPGAPTDPTIVFLCTVSPLPATP